VTSFFGIKVQFFAFFLKTTRRISGAGTILGQGGQDQKRQSLLREIRFFAEIELLFVPHTSALQKKRASPVLE